VKRLLIAALVAVCAVCTVQAAMDDVELGGVQVATAALTNSVFVRGEIGGVYISAPAGATGTVVITSNEGTLFTKSGITGSAFYPILYPMYSSAGVALTTVLSTGTNAVLGKMPVASKVTRVLTGECATTNTWTINLNVNK
jgi:hypothetical protein